MRELLVFGEKTFRITVPDDAKVTYGPFSPPTKTESFEARADRAIGTLRIYVGTRDNIVACFAGVRGFRDLSLGYSEQVAKEEGATIWKSDKDGYTREEKFQRKDEWLAQEALPAPRKPKR